MEVGGFIIGFLAIVKVAVYILIVNLSVNLLLRAYWVGLVGLKSVFKRNADADELGLQHKFKLFYGKRIKDLENTAVKIDGFCSIVFSFSFLQIFIFLSFGIYLFFIAAFGAFINSVVNYMYANAWNDTLISIATLVLVITFLFSVLIGVFSVVDFIGIGFLKRLKKRWLSNFFYYCNRFVRAITISFVYESLYYTILSNVSKRRIRFVLVGYAAIVLGFIMFKFTKDNLFPQQGSDFEVFKENYNNLCEGEKYLYKPTVQSLQIVDPYIELFIPYDISDNEEILKACPEFKPFVKTLESEVKFGDQNYNKEHYKKGIECFSTLYDVSVDDSLLTNLDFLFYRHPHNNEPGVLTLIPVSKFNSGKRVIKVVENYMEDKGMSTWLIPIWIP